MGKEKSFRSTGAAVSIGGDWRLVADVGGTRSRFALVDEAGGLAHALSLANADYSGLGEAAEAYLREVAPSPAPRRAAFAVATPITGDRVRLTNREWSFSTRQLQRRLGLDHLTVINDFTALALALPYLGAEHLRSLHSATGDPSAPRVILGPGTGLGVSALIPGDDGEEPTPVATEGGHRDFAAITEREWAVHQVLARRFGRVSVERVVSGTGMVYLYQALCEIDGEAAVADDAAAVVAVSDRDARARETLRIFAAQLGAFAGDLALTLGARGGVYLAGGVIPRLGERFELALFLQRYLAKGRFRSYVESIPVALVTHSWPALAGLAASPRVWRAAAGADGGGNGATG
ncbi:MAG: glucokinase [Acidobacteriota bacterium]